MRESLQLKPEEELILTESAPLSRKVNAVRMMRPVWLIQDRAMEPGLVSLSTSSLIQTISKNGATP